MLVVYRKADSLSPQTRGKNHRIADSRNSSSTKSLIIRGYLYQFTTLIRPFFVNHAFIVVEKNYCDP